MVPKDNPGWYQRTARGGTKGQHGVVPKDNPGWYQRTTRGGTKDRTARGGTEGQHGVVPKTGQRGVVPKRQYTTPPRAATRNECGTGVEATVGKGRCVKQTAFNERKKERKKGQRRVLRAVFLCSSVTDARATDVSNVPLALSLQSQTPRPQTYNILLLGMIAP